MEITLRCPNCNEPQILKELGTNCSQCQSPLLKNVNEALALKGELNQCPCCGARHLYRQKDFNRRVGIFILLIGIGMSFFTYGISLLIVTTLDLFLYIKVKEVACCYQCLAQFRGYPLIDKMEPFNLQLHDYYRSLVRHNTLA